MAFYGCTFGDKHTLKDWGLYQVDPPQFDPPEVKSNFVEALGRNGDIDASEAVTNDITFGDRNFECEYQLYSKRSRYLNTYSDIMDYLHGQRLKCVYDEDKNYYYIGRFEVNEYKSNKAARRITIEGTCYPFKMEMHTSVDDWLWDPFSFVNGVIRQYKNIVIQGEKDFHIVGSRMPVSPEIRAKVYRGDSITMEVDGVVYELKNGKNDVDLVIREGEHRVICSGYGRVTIKYRGGRL